MAPTLACLTQASRGKEPALYDTATAKSTLDGILSGADIIVGHNVAYDLAVACAEFPGLVVPVFEAYEAERVTDTMIRQQLLDIAAGQFRGYLDEERLWHPRGYSLEEVAYRCAGLRLKKTGFRLFYHFFRGLSVSNWDNRAREIQSRAAEYRDGAHDPEFADLRAIIGEKKWRAELDGLIAADPSEARTYALEDARATLAVYEAQEQHAKYMRDQFRQTYSYFVLHLSSVWGLRTNGEAVDALRVQIEEHYKQREGELIAAGLVKPKGTRDTKAAKRHMIEVCKAKGLPLRRTKGHSGDSAKCKGPDGPCAARAEECIEHVDLSRDACEATEDELLVAYAELSTDKKVLSNDIEALKKGVTLPVHPSYGLAETGRTTCRGPNIQNQSKREGIRECFVPRPGKLFVQCDYPQLELYTLAQCCVSWLGFSKLAEAINAGLDPHLMFAARVAGIPYEEALARYQAGDKTIKRFRDFGKVNNFGRPGGLGDKRLVEYAKKVYKLDLRDPRDPNKDPVVYAGELGAEWHQTWPEMEYYFDRVNALCSFEDPDGRRYGNVETLFTQRIRGRAYYNAACNNGFQALGSDCAKSAARNIGKRLYASQGHPLFGARLVAFVHDEFILEAEDGPQAHDVAQALAQAMSDGANVYLPDVPIPVSRLKPVLMKRWSKNAEQRFDEQGRLTAWI
jgi:DNA polymerase-1